MDYMLFAYQKFSYKRASQKNHEFVVNLEKSILGPADYNLPRGITPNQRFRS